jgi:arsenate reductase
MFAIPNCDTVKKARNFLEKNKIDYEFIDFKKSPPTIAQIKTWSDYEGELAINKKGMTYRKYKDQYEALSMSGKIDFIIQNPTLIKRPVLVQNGKTILMGFNEEQYKELLKTNQFTPTPLILSYAVTHGQSTAEIRAFKRTIRQQIKEANELG